MDAKKLSLEELDRMDIETFKKSDKIPVNIVLDDIRSALNVGSFFRTSDAFAINHIYLCGITATPPHKEILKTAIGATNSVSWSYEKSTTEFLESIKTSNSIISVEQTDQSIQLQDASLKKLHIKDYICLVFGNEVQGVNEEVIKMSDFCLEIPQFGTKHSLNVSVCGGAVIWEFWKLFNK